MYGSLHFSHFHVLFCTSFVIIIIASLFPKMGNVKPGKSVFFLKMSESVILVGIVQTKP